LLSSTVGLPPQSWQLEPVEHEQRALDPFDFAKGQRQAILPGISSQALEEERSADRSGAKRCREAQDIIPVGCDQPFVDAPGDERFEHRPSVCWSKAVKAPLFQVGNARGEIVTGKASSSKSCSRVTTRHLGMDCLK
jgi:hypothetical protein